VNRIITLGIDLAKSVFQLHGVDSAGHVRLRKQVRRVEASRRDVAESLRILHRLSNYRSLQRFYRGVCRVWRKWLNRRTRGKTLTWEDYDQLLERLPLLRPRITPAWTGAAGSVRGEAHHLAWCVSSTRSKSCDAARTSRVAVLWHVSERRG